MPALARRSRISKTRLLIAPSDRPPALERPDQGDLVGVLEVATDRQAAGDPADHPDHRLEALGEVHRGRLALEGRVGGHDHLDERLAVAGGCVGALEQLADPQPIRADAVDRRDRAVEDVVEALELARPLEGEDVERLLDDAQAGLVAARVAADRTERLIADVEAAVAEDDLVADVDERRGERARLGVLGPQQVEGQPLGGLRADARAGARTTR